MTRLRLRAVFCWHCNQLRGPGNKRWMVLDRYVCVLHLDCAQQLVVHEPERLRA